MRSVILIIYDRVLFTGDSNFEDHDPLFIVDTFTIYIKIYIYIYIYIYVCVYMCVC